MPTNHERVSSLFGLEVAEVLTRESLIRPETTETLAEPTHWRVVVWHPDDMKSKSYWDAPQNMRNEIKGGLWKNGIGSCLFSDERTARRNAKIASNAGYNVKITAMVLVEAETE